MLNSKINRLREYLTGLYETSQWKDTRLWTFIVFAVVVIVASWSGVRVIETNYELQKKISRLQQQNDVIRLQNENQRLKNQYLETDTYLELSARRQFSKAAAGEKLLIVPKNVALANTKEIPLQANVVSETQPKQDNSPRIIKNLRSWRDFVFAHKLDASTD